LLRRRFVTGDVLLRRHFVEETFCRGDVLLRRGFVRRRFVEETFRRGDVSSRRRFVEETFCKETFCMCVLHWPVHGLRESYFVSRNLLHDVLWLRGPLLTVVLSPQHRKMIGCFYEQIGFQHIPQNVVFCIFSRTALLSMDFGPGHGFRSNGTRGSLLDVQRSICGTTWSMLSASQL
jgi:hypothetical protein